MTKLPTDYFPADDLDAPRTDIKHLGVAGYVPPEKMFAEGCPKCRGTGRFTSWGGRTLGPCFACQGKGKNVYKTSPEARAKAKLNRAASFGKKLEAFCVEHQDIIDWFDRVVTQRPQNPFKFAASLREALAKYGSLTDAQIVAARKCIEQDKARDAQRAADRAAREAQAPTVDVTKLEQAFAVAREKAARPGQEGIFVKPLRLTADGITVLFRPGSIGSQWEGMLFAKTADDRKLGFVKDGKFHARREATPAEQAAVLVCASDPHTAVLAYAKAWSRCGVCGQQLLNDVSIEAGMGPVCRSKFGW